MSGWTASSEFGTYRLCKQRRFRRACASAQSHQNLRCSLIQAMSQEEPSDRKPDPWPLWMAGHALLKCVMTECSKTQIRLTRPRVYTVCHSVCIVWMHYSMEIPYESKFRIITVIFRVYKFLGVLRYTKSMLGFLPSDLFRGWGGCRGWGCWRGSISNTSPCNTGILKRSVRKTGVMYW